MGAKGVVSAGHAKTAAAAADVLEAGGNAFDAALAGLCAACVAEPVLASLGGGGFLLARDAEGRAALYDFFAQTPGRFRPPAETDFKSALADFGDVHQEFHIGLGAMAVPGAVRGLFAVHRDLGSVPMAEVVAPAVALARDGYVVDAHQAFIFAVVRAIYLATPAAREIFASGVRPDWTLCEGEVLRMRDFADTLDALAREGSDLFYCGDIAARIAADCRTQGGHLSREDLSRYQVMRREPLELCYRGRRIDTNPPPSTGGLLIAFALSLLDQVDMAAGVRGDRDWLPLAAAVMDRTNRARADSAFAESESANRLLDPGVVASYLRGLTGMPACSRGTTHLNVIDAAGNAAALTLSNGEGSAYVVPGTAIMMNNMLGEEDINPGGFHAWPGDRRMASMMAPTLVLDPDGGVTALGSGGSNRLRTAILQVLVRLVDFADDAEAAVRAPRIHVENGVVHVEPGFAEEAVAALDPGLGTVKDWPEPSMFFGGVHVAQGNPRRGRFTGAGDPRRGGVSIRI